MSLIKNALLLPLQHLIGQTPTAAPTDVDTGNVSLTLPVVPELARRSLSSQPTGGWFQGVLSNTHVSDDEILSTILPYNTDNDTVPPYPSIVPKHFDVWMIGCMASHASGAGGLAEALMSINPPKEGQGWGRDEQGQIVESTPDMQLARWDSIDTGGAVDNRDAPLLTEAGETWVKVNMRLPRGTRIRFETLSTGAAAVEFRCMFIMGLFPSGMGQDISF